MMRSTVGQERMGCKNVHTTDSAQSLDEVQAWQSWGFLWLFKLMKTNFEKMKTNFDKTFIVIGEISSWSYNKGHKIYAVYE